MPDLQLIKNDLEQLTAPTRADLTRIWQQIIEQQQDLIDRWPTLKPTERRRALRQLEEQVAAVIPAAGQLQIVVADIVRQAYQRGAQRTAGEVRQAVRYSQQDRDARQLFEADTYSELLQATRHVKQTTKELVRYLAKQHAADRLLGNTTAEQAARDLADDLTGRRISAIVYKDGSRHGLAEYSATVLRTKTAEAYQVGGFNQARSLGVTFMEILDGPSCGLDGHQDSRKANGLILPIEEAARFPISHPNCVMPHNALATYGHITEAARAWFSGPAVRLRAGLYEATVGPNHPVLTRRGWVLARLLNEGDHLVHDRRLGYDNAASVPGGLDLKQVPSVEDVWIALGEASSDELRADDFHGDAVFCEGEVEVVRPTRPLRLEDQPSLAHESSEDHLVRADERLAPISGVGQSCGVLISAGLPAKGGPDTAHPVFGGVAVEPSPVLGQSFWPAPDDASFTSHVEDQAAAAADTSGDFVRAVAGGVQLGEIVVVEGGSDLGAATTGAEASLGERVEGSSTGLARTRCLGSVGHDTEYVLLSTMSVGHFEGWVYDFTTVGGAFTVGGLVVKNCVRVTTARVDITTAEEARRGAPSTTAGQNADQAGVERRRLEAASRRAARRRTTQRLLDERTARSLDGGLLTRTGAVTAPAARRHSARLAARLRRLERP